MLQRLTYPSRQRQLLLIHGSIIGYNETKLSMNHNVGINRHHHPIVLITRSLKHVMTVLCKDGTIKYKVVSQVILTYLGQCYLVIIAVLIANYLRLITLFPIKYHYKSIMLIMTL